MTQKKYIDTPQLDESTGRVYGSELTIESDLFKLKVANTNKNIAIQESGQVDLEKVEHVHFFRTYDSDGTKQQFCVPVAGHFHEIEYVDDPKGGTVKIKRVSGPLRMVQKRVKGQIKNVPSPLHEDLEDNHTHEIEYLRSQKIQARAPNVRAMQLIGEEAQKGARVDGIQG